VFGTNFSKIRENYCNNNNNNYLFIFLDMKCSQAVSNLCNFGSTCMFNLKTNLVSCECDINCNLADPISLCGNDGVTYSSLCHLKQTKCLQQRSIKILNHNSCGKFI